MNSRSLLEELPVDRLPENLPSFEGKTVLLYSRSWDRKHCLGVLTSPTWELQGERLFLIGKAETSSDSWAKGGIAAVAWDGVGTYMVFEKEKWKEKEKRFEERSQSKSASGGFTRIFGRR